jgi:hypothetical protein
MTGADRYKDFPPGWNHIKIPLSSRRAALAGLAMYSACRPQGLWLQRVAWLWVRLLGPRWLPGRSVEWSPPVDGAWPELARTLREAIGPFDALAGYSRVQASRPGMALLLFCRGGPVAFVKLRHGHSDALANEERALRSLAEYGPRSFSAPRPLSSGMVSGWHYLAVSPLPARLHRAPARPPLGAILEEVEAALGRLPKPESVLPEWRPMHGDFAPWNLRQSGRGALFLIDWEGAGWGPPGADDVFYRATAAALAEHTSAVTGNPEAVRFWRQRINQRPSNSRDERLARALATVLEQRQVGLRA